MSNEIDIDLEVYGGVKRPIHRATETSSNKQAGTIEPVEPAEAAQEYGTGRPFRDTLKARLID